MPAPLTVTTHRRDDGAVTLTAAGEIDLSNVESFGRALTAAADGAAVITVDLSGVEYLDSAGINVLFAHADRIEMVVNPLLLPVLKVSGLADVVAITTSP